MVWPAILGIIPVVLAIILVADHIANNPEILEDFADAALVRCEINDLLYEKMVGVGLNPDQMAMLDAMMQGREVLVKDVRDLGGHVKHVVKVAKWGTLCGLVDG